MGEASEMSSVQSAWEDLVVENPNRAKLEACLLTTIMLVVLCIFALLTYVYVQLQPAGNVVTRPLFWKTTFGDSFPDRQFAFRMMGWMNWSSTRCMGFSEWACGGRLVEASSLAVYETAEMAAETYAKEYTIELMDRNDAYYTTSPTSDYSNLNVSEFGVPDNSFMALTQFFRSCRRGYPTMKEFLQSYKTTFGIMFVPNSEAVNVWTLFKLWQSNFSYYPLGDMYLTTKADKDAKLTANDEYITVEPIRLIGRPNDKTNKRYQTVVEDGFRSINLAVKGCCGDNGGVVPKFEKMIFDQLDKETIEDIDLGGLGGIRVKPPQIDMCEVTNTLTTNPKTECRYRQKRVAEAIKEVHGNSGADAINWAVLKFFIMLAPLMPADDPDLKNFFKVVAWYHRRDEMPHRDLLCMDLAAKFFPHALEALFAKDDFLNATKTEMLEVLMKLDAEFSGGSSGGKSGPLTVFTGQLFAEKSPFGTKAAKKLSETITEAWKAGYDRIVFFGPPDPHRPNVPPSNSTDPLQLISDVLKNTPRNNGTESWLGSRFSGDPYYDIRKDRIFAPIGLAMPPYYHFDGGKTVTVKHSMPAYATKLCKALVERFVKGFYKASSGGKTIASVRALEPAIGVVGGEQQRISTLVGKEVACFGKQVSPQLMWDLYFTKSGLSLAYQIWRKGYNHATANTDTQLRINYIKFMSEEMLFFVTAANGICNAANPALAAKKDVELAPKVVNSVVHCPLLGDTMLCDSSRPVFKSICAGLFPSITRADEALFTVEAWRQSKKVKWSY